MSLELTLGTKPKGLTVKTLGSRTIWLGDYEISLEDFLFMAHYVLTNTDLEKADTRLQFVECVRRMRVVDGYNHEGDPDSKRLDTDVSPVYKE